MPFYCLLVVFALTVLRSPPHSATALFVVLHLALIICSRRRGFTDMGLEKEYYIKSAQRGAFCDRGSDIADEGENDIRMTRSFLYSKQRMRSTPRSRFWTVVLLCWRTFAASCLVLAPSKQDFIVGYCKSSSNQLSKNGCCSGSSSKGSTWSSRTLASKLFVSGYGCRLSAQIMCRQRRGRVRWVRMDDEIARHGIKEV